ncbi:MAG TPA: MFS transporter [Alphaproteobacteria bacterium]
MAHALERSAMRKVYLRLLPFAILTYFLCYLDRINVGFAALTMNKALGLDPSTYGMAAGAFFWGYFLFEVPSNIILEKVGARIWIARIMVTWGLLSGATAFCTGPYSFLTVRFLLGLAEAGLFPGLVLFFTYWFPDRHRARIVSGFMLALPLAVATGAPMSTALLELDGLLGLAGWQWMFIAEAAPTVLIGIAVFFYVTDRPSQAAWLTDAERTWLIRAIDGESRQIEAHHKISFWRAFFEPKVLLLTLNYFGIVTASLGMLLFLPQMVKQLGLTNMEVGFVSMIPYICGSIAMVIWGWLSDRNAERRWNLATACLLSAAGLTIAGLTIGSWWSIVGMSLAAIGFYGSKGPFWAMPSMILTGTAAAAGIAWINAVGNLGGFFGPSIVGWVKVITGDFAGGFYALAAFSLMSAIISAVWLQMPRYVVADDVLGAAAE